MSQKTKRQERPELQADSAFFAPSAGALRGVSSSSAPAFSCSQSCLDRHRRRLGTHQGQPLARFGELPI